MPFAAEVVIYDSPRMASPEQQPLVGEETPAVEELETGAENERLEEEMAGPEGEAGVLVLMW